MEDVYAVAWVQATRHAEGDARCSEATGLKKGPRNKKKQRDHRLIHQKLPLRGRGQVSTLNTFVCDFLQLSMARPGAKI